MSQRSAGVEGRLRDIAAPCPPPAPTASSDENVIMLTWPTNSEPDMDGYLIFRNVCHGTDTNAWMQIGYLSQSDAQRLGCAFTDSTVPAGSPLCYSYVVKSQDCSQNKSGDWPIPPQPINDHYVCARLRDVTPPPPAVITKLEAQDSAVKVSWAAAPIQDIAAYYILRSDAPDGDYTFVGCLKIDRDSNNHATQTPRNQPLDGPSSDPCNAMYPNIIRELGSGSFTDSSVRPKRIYWYKVLGIDQSGNITRTNDPSAVPVSTFTFTTYGPMTPANVATMASTSPCQVSLSWSPAFDTQIHSGFMVLRSTTLPNIFNPSPFHQIGSLVTGSNQFNDSQVQRGVTYYYEIVTLDTRGVPSLPSPLTQATP